MEGYVTRTFGTNKQHVAKRSPLEDKTNIISNAKNVNEAMKLSEMSHEKRICKEIRGVTSGKSRSTNKNEEPSKSTVKSDVRIGMITRRKTKLQDRIIKVNDQKMVDKEKVVLCSAKEVQTRGNQKGEKSKENIYDKATKDAKRRNSFVQLEQNEAIMQKIAIHNTCHIFIKKDIYVDNIVKSHFRKSGKNCYVVLEDDTFVTSIIQSYTKQQSTSFSDMHEKKVGFRRVNKDINNKLEEGHLLRKRNSKQNYAEESLSETQRSEGESDNLKTNGNRKNVPIYKRVSLSKEPNEKKDVDVYELDISNDKDSEKRTRKKKKSGSSPNNSLPFERYMKVVVNKLEEKHKKQAVVGENGHAKSKKVKNAKSVPKKKKTDKLLVSNKETCLKPGKAAGYTRQIDQENAKKGSKVTEVFLCNLPTKGANLNQALNKNEHSTNTNISGVNIISNVVIQKNYNSNIQEKNFAREIREPNVSTVSNLSVNDANGIKSDTLNVRRKPRRFPATNFTEVFDNGNEADISDVEDNDENINQPVSNENLLNIEKTRISDQMGPIANSTMVNNSFQGTSSPWRLNLEVRRNPHFLQYKHSLLPNYNQEMVLNSSVMEKSFSKPTAIKKIVQPAQKQASILKYVSGGKHLENLDHINIECSLFDEHEFSPVKKISPKKKNLENKENFSGNIRKKVECAKRNILGPKVDNIQNVTSPPAATQRTNRSFSTDSSTSSDFFGFDNMESEIQVHDPSNKPFRIHSILPKIIRAKQDIQPIVDECTEEKKKEKFDKEAYLKEIGLFEDYHPEKNIDYSAIKQYKRRVPRRRRSPSPATTESEDEDYHKKQQVKRKKNLRTKEEEAEAEKWADEFNKMCEEVEKFPLEIE